MIHSYSLWFVYLLVALGLCSSTPLVAEDGSGEAYRRYTVILHNLSEMPLELTFRDVKEGFKDREKYQKGYTIKEKGTLVLYDRVLKQDIGSEEINFINVVPYSAPVDNCSVLLFNETQGSVVRFKVKTDAGVEERVNLGYRIVNKRSGSDEKKDYLKIYNIYFKKQ